MENSNIYKDSESEDFDFGKHALNALSCSLWYLIIYIPFLLPYIIWGKAAARLSQGWESKSLTYSEGEKIYPLHSFYLMYLLNFLFDAIIFLAWPLGFLLILIMLITGNGNNFMSFLVLLFSVYSSVIVLKASKEVLHFCLNNLVTWFLDVIVAIGRFMKHAWALNFVTRKKD